VKLALFGGTFDPVHAGHMAAARAAMETFALDEIHFVPATHPPHKHNRPLAPFEHRYAMVALACAEVEQFVPSLVESPAVTGDALNYSIETVARMSATLAPGDKLFFIIGADAFLEIGTWHEPVALLDACDFIIVNRPGFPIEKIEFAIPKELQPIDTAGGTLAVSRSAVNVLSSIRLRKTTLHLLHGVAANVSASDIRSRAAAGKPLTGLVTEKVADYIRKTRVYHGNRGR
jgi:nicotinate-nucleotide adenylyltransferase